MRLHLFGLEDRYVHGVELSKNGSTITKQGPMAIQVPRDGSTYYHERQENIMVQPIGKTVNATNLSISQVKYLLGYSNIHGVSEFSPTRETQEFINEYKNGIVFQKGTLSLFKLWYPNLSIDRPYYDGTSKSSKFSKEFYDGLNKDDKTRIDNYLNN